MLPFVMTGIKDDNFPPHLIPYSCRFDEPSLAHMSRTPAGAGDRQVFTVAYRVKLCKYAANNVILFARASGTQHFYIYFNTDGKICILDYDSGNEFSYISTATYRDPTSHYNFLVAIDTTEATEADRVKVYLDNDRIIDWDTEDTCGTQNHECSVNSTGVHYIGFDNGTYYSNMNLSDFHIISGSQLTPSSFNYLKSGIWVSKAYTGHPADDCTCYLDFSDPNDLGADQINGNDWTEVNLAATDQLLDTPTNNFDTMNPIDLYNSSLALTEGNLKVMSTDNVDWEAARSWMFIDAEASENRYWEITVEGTGTIFHSVGIAKAASTLDADLGTDTNSLSLYFSSGSVWYDGVEYTHGSAIDIDDVIMFAFLDGGLYIGLNGNWADGDGNFDEASPTVSMNSEASLSLEGHWAPAVSCNRVNSWLIFNFGQGDPNGSNNYSDENGYGGFKYEPPTTCLAQCSQNQTEPTIIDSSEGFVAEVDTGVNIPTTLASARSGWTDYLDILKNRDNIESWDWIFSDDPTNSIHSDTDAGKGAKQALAAGDDYVGYSIRVGARYGVYTDEISHTNGVETDQAHGLGSGGKMGIVKRTDSAGSWWTSHPGLTANYNIILDTPTAETATEYVAIDGTNITIKAAAPTGTYRVIGFSEVEGFLKIFTYIGNADADGTYTDCGLRLKSSLFLQVPNADNRSMLDTARDTFNPAYHSLYPNGNDVESIALNPYLDILSKGFKLRTANVERNGSGRAYIGIAWAEQPGKYSNAR